MFKHVHAVHTLKPGFYGRYLDQLFIECVHCYGDQLTETNETGTNGLLEPDLRAESLPATKPSEDAKCDNKVRRQTATISCCPQSPAAAAVLLVVAGAVS